MPIVDVELVCESEADLERLSVRTLADALGRAFGTPPGRTWVRVRHLPAARYAENESSPPAGALPVFVTVLQARPPEGDALAAQTLAITEAVARSVGRPPERVHVAHEPAAAGRQAFGGVLVR